MVLQRRLEALEGTVVEIFCTDGPEVIGTIIFAGDDFVEIQSDDDRNLRELYLYHIIHHIRISSQQIQPSGCPPAGVDEANVS